VEIFFANIAHYLGNGTRLGYSYYGTRGVYSYKRWSKCTMEKVGESVFAET